MLCANVGEQERREHKILCYGLIRLAPQDVGVAVGYLDTKAR